MNESKNNSFLRTIKLVAMAVLIYAIVWIWRYEPPDSPQLKRGPLPNLPKTNRNSNSGTPGGKSAEPQGEGRSQFRAASSWRFRGHVVDKNGKGVSGVTVVCTDCEATDQKTVSDENGSFTLPHPIELDDNIQFLHLVLSKNGYSFRYYAGVDETPLIIFSPE